MKRLLFTLIALFTLVQGFSQGVFDDFNFRRNAVKERKVIYWPPLREADVMFHWRVERIIDTREKINMCMAWPKNPLWKVMETAIMKDKTMVPFMSDSLLTPFTEEELNKKLSWEETTQIQLDPNDPYNVKDSTFPVFYDWEKIKRFKIMEDWIFDRKESRMYCRIVYIAPMFKPYIPGIPDEKIKEMPICFVKYHDNDSIDLSTFRAHAVNQEVYNRFNDAARISYDDFFEMRMFGSYIIKESNAFDYSIREFAEFKDDPVAAHLESDKIKQRLFEYEHDVWEY